MLKLNRLRYRSDSVSQTKAMNGITFNNHAGGFGNEVFVLLESILAPVVPCNNSDVVGLGADDDRSATAGHVKLGLHV